MAGTAWRSSTGCGVVGGGCRVPGGWGLAILHHQSADRSTTGLDVRTLASPRPRAGALSSSREKGSGVFIEDPGNLIKGSSLII